MFLWINDILFTIKFKKDMAVVIHIVSLLKAISPTLAGLILGLGPANERRRYFVTTSLTGWAQV